MKILYNDAEFIFNIKKVKLNYQNHNLEKKIKLITLQGQMLI